MKLFIVSFYFIMLIYIYIYIFLKIHVWERTYEPVIILHMREEGGSYGFHREQRGIDRQLTANDEGGSFGFQREQRGY